MRVPRIFHSEPLVVDQSIELDEDAANHVARVLRLGVEHELALFCGDNHVYRAVIIGVDKKRVHAKVLEKTLADVESPLRIHLVQGISRGDRMDFTLQKSVELGVASITPVFTERCGVKLQGERLVKRHQQWQKIVIAACEQSGRNQVPLVHQPITLDAYLANADRPQTLTLEPSAQHSLKSAPVAREIALLIGPEGGFSESEIARTHAANCTPVRLGPRVLRTETAALAALAALQANHGDLA